MMSVTSTKFSCPINGYVTLKFETDAEDNYFDDHLGLGEVDFIPDIVQRSRLRTGIYTLTLNPSLSMDNLQVGQKVNFKFTIYEKKEEKFIFEIPIEITDAIPEPEETKTVDEEETETTEEGTEEQEPRKPPRPFTREEKADPNSKQNQSLIDRPEFKGISKEDDPETWEKLFEGNENRGASVEIDSNGRLLKIWVNMSHPHLIHYQEITENLTLKRLVVKYVNFIGFYTWSVFLNVESKKIHYPENYDIKQIMEATADALAFFGLGYLDASSRI